MKKITIFILFLLIPCVVSAGIGSKYKKVIARKRVAGGACTGTGTLGYSASSSSPGTARAALYIAATAGSDICITNGYIHVATSFTTSDHLRIVIWDTSNNVLATSNEITGTSTETTLSATFPTPYQVTNGTAYRIGWVADADIDYYFNFAGGSLDSFYANPAYTGYPDPSGLSWVASSTGQQIELYLTGE